MSNISVLIAEDHKTVRAGLKLLINSEPDMEVIDEAGDGSEAIRLAQELQPDVMIMDISMPGVSGLVAAATAKRVSPGVNILILTRHTDRAYLNELLQAGISGYVLKQSDSDEMLRAIRIVAGGGRYLDPGVTGSVMGMMVTSQNHNENNPRGESLNDRELEVLRRVARGCSNREIADQLDTNIKTIESQKASALRKLNIKGRSEIVDYAIVHGWFRER